MDLSSIFSSTEKFQRKEGSSVDQLATRKRHKRRNEDTHDREDDDKDRIGVDDVDGLTDMELARIKDRKRDRDGDAAFGKKKERKPAKPAKTADELAAEEAQKVDEEATRLKAMSDNEKQSVNKSQRTVFVGNVSIAANEKQIRELFKAHGEVESVRLRSVPLAGVKVDDHGNQDLVKRISANKGKMGDQKESQNAYIVFAAVDSVVRAIKALDNVKFLTRTLRVDTETPSLFDTSTTVFLGGLSKFCDEERLREFFAKVLPNGQADITGMRLVRDTETLYGKGFGYLMLADRDGVMGALKNDGKRFKGRDMRVTTCGKRTKRQSKERAVPRVPKAEGGAETGADGEGVGVGEGGVEGEEEVEMSKKEKKKNKKPTEFEAAAARRMKQKMAKNIAKMKQQKQVGLNKNLKKGRKLGGVIKKALKATSGKTGKAQGLNKGTKSEARFKPTKVKAR